MEVDAISAKVKKGEKYINNEKTQTETIQGNITGLKYM